MADIGLKISLKALINLIHEAQQQANVVPKKEPQKQQQKIWPNTPQIRKSQKNLLPPRLQAQTNFQHSETRNFNHTPVFQINFFFTKATA